MRFLKSLVLLSTLPALLLACATAYVAKNEQPAGVALKSRSPVVATAPASAVAVPVVSATATPIITVTTAQLPSLNAQNVRVTPIGVALVKRDFARLPGAAGLYFYRDAMLGGEPYSVFVNGKYLTTLKPGTWSLVQLCPGEYVLQLVPESALLADKRNFPGTALSVSQAGADYFVLTRLMPGGNSTLSNLDPIQGLALLQKYQQMNQLVPRVDLANNCQSRPIRPSTALHRYVLNAEVLFNFGAWRLNPGNMVQVRRLLNDIAKDIQTQNILVERIEITGHTDPVGTPAANQQLSMRRATEVMRYLQGAGLSRQSMAAYGLGEAQLLDADCARKFSPSPEMEQCNEVNRRVEIAVYGKRPAPAATDALNRTAAPTSQ